LPINARERMLLPARRLAIETEIARHFARARRICSIDSRCCRPPG
jgi:hypothetical protein